MVHGASPAVASPRDEQARRDAAERQTLYVLAPLGVLLAVLVVTLAAGARATPAARAAALAVAAVPLLVPAVWAASHEPLPPAADSFGCGSLTNPSRPSDASAGPACDRALDRQRALVGLLATVPLAVGVAAPLVLLRRRRRDEWYAVRCVLSLGWPADGTQRYEERVTLWRAASPEQAVAKAEDEARGYAAGTAEAPDAYLGLAQSYPLVDEPGDGAEVLSLVHHSDLPPEQYLDAFFDTGAERQREL